jgi:hypothetical protein
MCVYCVSTCESMCAFVMCGIYMCVCVCTNMHFSMSACVGSEGECRECGCREVFMREYTFGTCV